MTKWENWRPHRRLFMSSKKLLCPCTKMRFSIKCSTSQLSLSNKSIRVRLYLSRGREVGVKVSIELRYLGMLKIRKTSILIVFLALKFSRLLKTGQNQIKISESRIKQESRGLADLPSKKSIKRNKSWALFKNLSQLAHIYSNLISWTLQRSQDWK